MLIRVSLSIPTEQIINIPELQVIIDYLKKSMVIIMRFFATII